MKATAALERSGVFAFLALFAVVLSGLWPSYFSRLPEQTTHHAHAYAFALILWCALLVTQSSLIRSNRRALHKRLGKLSYGLAPLTVIASIHFVHFRLSDIPVPQLTTPAFHLLALVLNALAVFVTLYALAIYHRHNTALHARYMLGTAFPLAGLMLSMNGMPLLRAVSFVLADAILIALVLWDWRSKPRINAFPAALVLWLLYQGSALTFQDIRTWRVFCSWFMNLPLS
jgi:hypothetical protein